MDFSNRIIKHVERGVDSLATYSWKAVTHYFLKKPAVFSFQYANKMINYLQHLCSYKWHATLIFTKASLEQETFIDCQDEIKSCISAHPCVHSGHSALCA